MEERLRQTLQNRFELARLPLNKIPPRSFLFPTQHVVAHLGISQGPSNSVFHPSPSVLHTTSPELLHHITDLDLITAQAAALPLPQICCCEALLSSLCSAYWPHVLERHLDPQCTVCVWSKVCMLRKIPSCFQCSIGVKQHLNFFKLCTFFPLWGFFCCCPLPQRERR